MRPFCGHTLTVNQTGGRPSHQYLEILRVTATSELTQLFNLVAPRPHRVYRILGANIAWTDAVDDENASINYVGITVVPSWHADSVHSGLSPSKPLADRAIIC